MATTYQPSQWLMPKNANTGKVGNYSLYGDGVGADLINISGLGITEDWSISFWINQATIKSPLAYPISWLSNQGIFISYSGGTPAYAWGIFDGSSLIYGSATNTTDTWMHFVVTKSGTTYTIYKDSSSEGSGTLADMDIDDIVLFERTDGVGPTNCSLSEVCIFNYALTSGNVTTLWGDATDGVGNPMGLDPVPVGYWKGDKAGLGDQWAVPNQVSKDYVFDFDGSDYIDIINSATVPANLQDIGDNNSYSISCWIQTTGGSGVAGYWWADDTICELREESSDADTKVPFSFGVASDKICVGRTADYTTNAETELSTTSVNDGEWHHVGIVIVDDAYTFYLDGIADGSGSFASATGDCSVGTDTSNMQIGIRARDAGLKDTNPFVGNISNVALWNSELSAANMLTIYNNGTPGDLTSLSPISWWKLDDSATFSTNWSIPDAGSASNTGTSSGMTQGNLVPDTVTRGTAMYSEYSFDFDGVGDKITIGNPASLQITGAMSLSCWVNFDYGSQTAVLTKDQLGGSLRVFSLWVDAWSGVGVSFTIFSGGVATSIQGVTAINDGNWHHVAATFEPSTALKVYIDGILDATNTTSIPATIDNDAADFVIGAFYNSTSFNYAGKVCEVAVWNSTLSAANVLTIYNNGRPADLTDLSPVSWWKLGNEAFWDGSNWIIKDNGSASNTGTSAGNPNLIGDAPQSFANGLSVSMDIDDRIGESGFSDENALSYNMDSEARSTSVPA